VLELMPHDVALDSLEVERDGGLAAIGELPSSVYVCHDDEARALAAAFAVSKRLQDAAVAVVVQMQTESGLATLCSGPEGCAAGSAGVIGFALHERTCTIELLFDELLARAIHATYVRNRAADGETVASNPSMAPWEALPEHLRESNRRQADHVAVKLEAVGCALAPRIDWVAPLVTFTPDEVERMARMEHERFVAERRAAGWQSTDGPKDVARKLAPYLVDWEALPDEIREYDREAVRVIPALAREGEMEVVRRANGA
jgi:hypothetical protein